MDHSNKFKPLIYPKKISYFLSSYSKYRHKLILRDKKIQLLAHRLFENTKLTLVLDLGANRGNFSLVASQYAEKVLAFEPHVESFNILRANMPSNVTCYNKAVTGSKQFTKVRLYSKSSFNKYQDLYESESSSLKPDKKNLVHAKESMIETFDLNEILNSFIDVVKMDIEGSELELLPIFYNNQHLIGKLYAEIHASSFENPDKFKEQALKYQASNFYFDWI